MVAGVGSGAVADQIPEALHGILELIDAPFGRVQAIDGGTQVRVWRIDTDQFPYRAYALRLVKRPLDLLERQARALADVPENGVRIATILANRQLPDDPARCAQLTRWMSGRHPTPRQAQDAEAIGAALARLHLGLASHAHLFEDRPLILGDYRSYVADLSRHVDESGTLAGLGRNKRSILLWELHASTQLPSQLLHGDLHAKNVLVSDPAMGGPPAFIDFDKMMVGPRVFDIAKYVSTSCFFGHPGARLARAAVVRFLDGYTSVSPLTDPEIACLDALCVVLNVESALCGANYEIPALVDQADAVGAWWARRPTIRPGPTGTRPVVDRDQPSLFAPTT